MPGIGHLGISPLLGRLTGGYVYKIVQVAPKNLVRVARLVARAMVLDHLVGMEDIGTDLAPPLVRGRRRDTAALRLRRALGLFFSEHLRLQELHTLLAIGELAPLA